MKYDFSDLTERLRQLNFSKINKNKSEQDESMFVSKDTLLSYFDWISDTTIIDKYLSDTLTAMGYLDLNGKITDKAINYDILRYNNGTLLFGPCIVDWIVREGMKSGWLNIKNIESNEIYKQLDKSFNLDQIVSNKTLSNFAKIVNQLNLGIKVYQDKGLNRYAYIINKLESSPHIIFCNMRNTYKQIALDMQLLYDIANDIHRTDISKEVKIIKNSKMNYNGLDSNKNLYDFAKLIKCWLSLPATFRQKNGFVSIMPFLLKNRTKFEILYRGIKLEGDPIKHKKVNDEISFSLVSTSKGEGLAKGYIYDSPGSIAAMIRFHNLYGFDLTEFDKFDIYEMAGGSEEVLVYGTFVIKNISEQNGLEYYDLVPKDQSEQELNDLMQQFKLKDNKISFSKLTRLRNDIDFSDLTERLRRLNFSNLKEITLTEMINEIKSNNYPLAIEDGLLDKLKDRNYTDNAKFYRNNGAICIIALDNNNNECSIRHLERSANAEKGSAKNLLNFILDNIKAKVFRLTAQGGNQKLVDYYKSFGFEETNEPCDYGIRMIKN